MSCKDYVLSSSLRSEGFDVNEEINNTMDGIPKEESCGYKCNSFEDATSDGTLRKASFESMREGMNGEGNGKEEEERVDNVNWRRNFCIPSKGRLI